MKDIWRERYQSLDTQYVDASALVGFNANIDVKYDIENPDIDLEDLQPKDLEKVSDRDDFKSLLAHCIQEGKNKEVNYEGLELEEGGEEEIGGQAGIMANFLSGVSDETIFYTPFLSKRLAGLLEPEIKYPTDIEGEFSFEPVREAVNTDRTKINRIFEFENKEGKTGRLILSDKLRGFGPYFRRGVEEKISFIDDRIDRALLSGFHNADGNVEAKMKKASQQLEGINTPIHMEYVDLSDKLNLLEKYVFPHIQSIGLDEYEMKSLEKALEVPLDNDEPSLGEAFQFAKFFLNEFDLSRVHIHTYRYHLNVTSENYEVEPEKIRESMLFGETSAIKMADRGEIPDEVDRLDFENKHVRRLDDLEDFSNFMNLKDFVKTGIAKVDGLNVVAIPPVIHEDPKRLVGMGDLISAGTFIKEAD